MYVINQNSKFPIFQINDHIGFDSDILDESGNVTEKGDGQGIDGKVFSSEFFETDSLNPDLITVYTNSIGGDVKESLDMFNAIARAKSKTKGVISGFAYSCGGWLPLGCDNVEMAEHASWMCHMPYDPKNEDEKSDFMDAVVNTISTILSSKSGRNGKKKKSKDDIIKMMKTKTYYTAQQMYDEGLIDKIVDSTGKKIVINLDNLSDIKNFYKEKQVALNNFLNREFDKDSREKLAKEGKALPDGSFPIVSEEDLKNAIHAFGRAKDKESAKKHIEKRAKELGLENLIPDNWKINNKYMSYKRIVNRLNSVKAKNVAFNLSDDSTEQDILDSIVNMENKLNASNMEMENAVKEKTASEESVKEMKKKMEEKQSEAENATKSYNDMKEAYDKMCMENKDLLTKQEAANKEKDAAILKEKEVNAKNLIKKYVDCGKISAANKEDLDVLVGKWEKRAVDNYEDTDLMLSSQPVKMSIPTPSIFKEDTKFVNSEEESIILKRRNEQAANRDKERKIKMEKINS